MLQTSILAEPGVIAFPPSAGSCSPTSIVHDVVSLVQIEELSTETVDATLKAIRGGRTSGRRVVWCRPAELGSGSLDQLRSFGRKLAVLGGAELVVTVGHFGRELALSARDAGLPLGRVVACRDDATARNVLADSLNPNDFIVAAGIDVENCRLLVERLQWRFECSLAAAG